MQIICFNKRKNMHTPNQVLALDNSDKVEPVMKDISYYIIKL